MYGRVVIEIISEVTGTRRMCERTWNYGSYFQLENVASLIKTREGFSHVFCILCGRKAIRGIARFFKEIKYD